MILLDTTDHYQDAINLIGSVESSPQEKSVVVLSMKDIFSEKVKITKYNRAASEKAADYVSMMVPYNQAEEARAHPQAQQPQWLGGIEKMAGEIEKKGVSKGSAYLVLAEKELKNAVDKTQKAASKRSTKQAAESSPQNATRQRDPQPKQPANIHGPASASMANIQKSAAAELHGIIKSAPSSSVSVGTEKPPGSGTLLPALPVAEQVLELDKISAGLDGNVFNKEQLKIISDEVSDLARSAKARENREAQGPLVQLRDQKLDSVLERLRKIGA